MLTNKKVVPRNKLCPCGIKSINYAVIPQSKSEIDISMGEDVGEIID